MSPRPDVLTPIHKALELLMFDTAALLGRTDFTSDAEATRAEQEVRRCVAYLREHMEHEDRWLAPVLERLAPGLASTMLAEHAELERAEADAVSMCQRLGAAADGLARVDVGGELRRTFDLLLARQLRHMTWEERDVNAALWGGLSDGEVLDIAARVVAAIGPAHMRDWDGLVLAASNPQERQAHAQATAQH